MKRLTERQRWKEAADSEGTGRGARRWATALVALAPTVGLLWMGCSSDDGVTGYGPVVVDPGGTFGAEVSLTVVGRGRVRTATSEIDCPSSCFGKYIFDSAAADGAAGSVGLIATPTAGSRFAGWSFSTAPSGTRGRGPSSCNPIVRAGSEPAVDKNALEIRLPFGEVAGTPPAGKEGACGGSTTVPLVYNLTATFVTDPPPDIDGGADAGALEVLYSAPIIGATGREVGLTTNNYLYWHFLAGGLSGIAYDTSVSGTAPQSATVIVSPSTIFTLFEVDPYGVAYQDSSGAISVIRYGTSTPMPVAGAPPTCTALAVDSSYNVYCRTTSTLVQWTYGSGYATANVLHTGLPNGSDLVVESSSGPAYLSNGSAILSVPITGADGGVPAPTTVVSGSFGAVNLEANASRFFWIDPSGYVRGSSGKSVGGIAYDTSVPPSLSLKYLAQDPLSTSHFWAASSTSVWHAYYFGGTSAGATEPLRTDLAGINGMTADGNYVYLSLADGTIRRISTSQL